MWILKTCYLANDHLQNGVRSNFAKRVVVTEAQSAASGGAEVGGIDWSHSDGVETQKVQLLNNRLQKAQDNLGFFLPKMRCSDDFWFWVCWQPVMRIICSSKFPGLPCAGGMSLSTPHLTWGTWGQRKIFHRRTESQSYSIQQLFILYFLIEQQNMSCAFIYDSN